MDKQEITITNQPFSKRLNDWILKVASDIPYKVVYDDSVTGSFESIKRYIQDNGVIPIDGNNCENNIFGSKDVNIAFRAWHDLTHIKMNEDFSPMGETRVAFKQASELPKDWWYEKMLIMSEVSGQVTYHDKHGDFVEDQREFTKKLINI